MIIIAKNNKSLLVNGDEFTSGLLEFRMDFTIICCAEDQLFCGSEINIFKTNYCF